MRFRELRKEFRKKKAPLLSSLHSRVDSNESRRNKGLFAMSSEA